MSRQRHEDITRQCEAAEQARADLTRACYDLSVAAKAASRGRGSLDEVYAGTNRVRRAEEAYDLALLDVATARGEDA